MTRFQFATFYVNCTADASQGLGTLAYSGVMTENTFALSRPTLSVWIARFAPVGFVADFRKLAMAMGANGWGVGRNHGHYQAPGAILATPVNYEACSGYAKAMRMVGLDRNAFMTLHAAQTWLFDRIHLNQAQERWRTAQSLQESR